MHSGQIYVKTLFPTRSYPNYVSYEVSNFRVQPNLFRSLHVYRSSMSNNVCVNLSELSLRFKELLESSHLIKLFKYSVDLIPKKLKNESVKCVRTWTRQCECVSAQQLRRRQQMITLYRKLWGERALNEFFRLMRNQLIKRGKQFIIGAVGISVFDWDKNRISDEEILQHTEDFAYIALLREKETHCEKCKKPRPVDFADPNAQYCKCPPGTESKECADHWEPYLQRKNLFVWRRKRPNGCFEYKVYGKYDDVTAEDFLRVQIDIDYRKQWDTNAIVLNVVETESTTNSDVIYWEMQWPVSIFLINLGVISGRV